MVISEELNEELSQAAVATTQAYTNARNASSGMINLASTVIERVCTNRFLFSLLTMFSTADDPISATGGAHSSALEDMIAEKERYRDQEDPNRLSSKVLVMQPILRFLQLLCENHNRDLQVCLSSLSVEVE